MQRLLQMMGLIFVFWAVIALLINAGLQYCFCGLDRRPLVNAPSIGMGAASQPQVTTARSLASIEAVYENLQASTQTQARGWQDITSKPSRGI